jgi:23S rRNA (guanine745-N1)-methyltransferase
MSESIYKCPVCSLRLVEQLTFFRCENNHTFDKSAAGYLNLLLANEKASKEPGDSKEMLLARRSFLGKGFYSPLLDYLQNYINLEFSEQNIHVLDLGCGEGYYSGNLQYENLQIYGMDISKPAITLAAKAYPQLNLSVASSFKLPYLDQSFDFIFCIFSPYSLPEVARVLKPGGMFMIVDPNPGHLADFSDAVLGEFKPHEGNRQHLTESLELSLVSEANIRFVIKLESNNDIQDLLTMTPYYWRLSKERREIVNALDSLTTRVDFGVHVLNRKQVYRQ